MMPGTLNILLAIDEIIGIERHAVRKRHILHRLNTRDMPRSCMEGYFVWHRVARERSIADHSYVTAVRDKDPPMSFATTYLHTLDGRLRVKVAEVKGLPAMAVDLKHRLPQVTGIDHVKANPITGNVLILYTSDRISQQEILTCPLPVGVFAGAARYPTHDAGSRGISPTAGRYSGRNPRALQGRDRSTGAGAGSSIGMPRSSHESSAWSCPCH
jgi:hypothetical protein